MITISPEKGRDAIRLGADDVLVSIDSAAMATHAHSFHFLLNTIPVGHDLNPYAQLLKRGGTMVLVGAWTALEPALRGFNLISGRRSVAGSVIGGLPETQEMMDFCGQHKIVSEVEMTPIQSVNGCHERMLIKDFKYRFVIDMASLNSTSV